VEEAQDGASAKIAEAQLDADARIKEADRQSDAAQQEAIDKAVADAMATEKGKRDELIKDAVDEAVSEANANAEAEAPALEPRTLVDGGGGGGTDPRFDTCGKANAAGYGSYRRGVDTEYNWYQDRDNDGVVCE